MNEHPEKKAGAPNNPQSANPLNSGVIHDGPTNTGDSAADNKRGKINWILIRDIVFAIGAFSAISILVWQAAHWLQERVDQAVEAKLTDEKVLRQIAAQVRPSLVFNASESIVTDMGASAVVKNIHVLRQIAATPDATNVPPTSILIDFHRHFSSAPIVTSMYDTVVVIPKRSKGFSWEFSLEYIIASGAPSDSERLYRLELIP